MNKFLTTALGVALVLAFAAPALQASAESNRDANLAWLLERRGDMDMDMPVTLYVGGEAFTLTAAEALHAFGERSLRLNIPAIIAGASHAPPGQVQLTGDFEIFEDTFQPFVGCPTANVISPTPWPFTPVNDQLYLYGGAGFVLHDEAHSNIAAAGLLDFGIYSGWTQKIQGSHTGLESSVAGNSDLWCIDWGSWGATFWPWANGLGYIG